ncbi:hypothetical protein K439DRAFT_1620932 [Ramaria rubella]|nr:hypothetical protein K439DRAFT_1620932 [Ramaria rubella]
MTTPNRAPYGNPFPTVPALKSSTEGTLTARELRLIEMEHEECEEMEAMCQVEEAFSFIDSLATNKRPYSLLETFSDESLDTFKTNKCFKPQQVALLDEWSENAHDHLSCELLTFGVQLEIHAAVTSLAASQLDNHKPLPALHGVMLAPCLTAYRGEDVMCELNVTGVPNPKDEDKITVVIKEIQGYTTGFHNITKTVLMDSIKNGDDICKLALEIVGTANIHAAVTMPVMIHLAFLCVVIAEHPSDTWLTVNHRMRD